jgi:hypothetical protein
MLLAARRSAALRPSGDLPAPPLTCFVFTARNAVLTQGNAPTAAEIEGALRSVQTRSNTAPAAANPLGLGDWVGPRARVTRQALLAIDNHRVTLVAWPYCFPQIDTTTDLGRRADADRRARLLSQAQGNLARLPRSGDAWSGFALAPYDPVANGGMDWWQNGGAGGAGDTHTRDAFDLNQQLGDTSTIENPVGPPHATPAGLHVPGGVTDSVNAVGRLVVTGAVVAAGGVALWYAWPLLAATRPT